MSNKHIEKSFLYLVLLSILLHVAAFGVVSLIPPEPQSTPNEFTMVDLKDIPPPPVEPQPQPRPKPQPKPRQLVRRIPLPLLPAPLSPREGTPPTARKEAAPKAETIERIVPDKSLPEPSVRTGQAAGTAGKPDSVLRTPEKGGKEAMRGEGLLKPQRGIRDDLAKLFPSARNMGKMEEGFRNKYIKAEHGDTQLMDTDDPVIGVFKRRYRENLKERLNAIDSSVRKGRGMTILNITFKRDGTIAGIKVLDTTGNASLDELAVKAVRTASYSGPLPKNWPHEELNLIFSFVIVADEGVAGRWQ